MDKEETTKKAEIYIIQLNPIIIKWASGSHQNISKKQLKELKKHYTCVEVF